MWRQMHKMVSKMKTNETFVQQQAIGTFVFIFDTILCICRHIFAQLPHGLQLAPVIAAESRMRRGVADQVLVHAVSMAASGLLVIFWHSRQHGVGEAVQHSCGLERVADIPKGSKHHDLAPIGAWYLRFCETQRSKRFNNGI